MPMIYTSKNEEFIKDWKYLVVGILEIVIALGRHCEPTHVVIARRPSAPKQSGYALRGDCFGSCATSQ